VQSFIHQKCIEKLATSLKIDVYRKRDFDSDFYPLPPKRDWMDDTFDKHAYRCFPVNIANTLGWTFSFPKDISFIWDGTSTSEDGHVKVLSGEEYVFTNRANATISFNSGLTFMTEENVSLLMMPVPNQFIDGVHGFTTMISTSVLTTPIPYAWKITKANEVITIPANTPIVSIIPISLTDIQNTEVNLYIENFPYEHFKKISDYADASHEISKKQSWTNFYRDAVDHEGNQQGNHELKSLRLKIVDHRDNN
jgi:hypothetical protein